MTDIGDRDMDGEDAPVINGGLLDPRTFPSPWPPAPATEQQAAPPSPDQDVHAQVLQDILDAQAKLPPIGTQPADDAGSFPARSSPLVTDGPSLDRPAAAITGPLRTSVHDEVFQDILNAQARLPPVKPRPETWLINGRTYNAISAGNFDPALSGSVTSMPTPAQDAAAWTGKSLVVDPAGRQELTGFIPSMPTGPTATDVDPATGLATALHFEPSVLQLPGAIPGITGNAYTSSFHRPDAVSPYIHSHPDKAPDANGMVDEPDSNGGYGDTQSLYGPYPVPMATVSHGQVGWHVLDNSQLKFLYPPGSMTPSQIQEIQQNLNQEQKKFRRPK